MSIASLNYRLSPHARHATDPSSASDPSRNAVWPAHALDVMAGVRWLCDDARGGREGFRGGELLLVGHSVGATLAVEVAGLLAVAGGSGVRVCGVGCLAGVFDFVALRDAHAGAREMYEGFIEGAFGPEGEGGWEGARVRGERVREGLRGEGVLVLGRSRADELVEWGQVDGLLEELEQGGEGGDGLVVRLVECEGTHKEIVHKGVEVARCVAVALDVLMRGGEEAG